MGLAPITAVQAETFSEPPGKPSEIQSGFGSYNRERYARSFEQLAAEIRRDAVIMCDLKFSSEISSDKIVDMHTITVTLIYSPEV